MSAFSDNLRKFRKIERFTQYSFGEHIGIKQHNIGAYEEGRAEPSIEKYLLICKTFKQDPKDFYNKHL